MTMKEAMERAERLGLSAWVGKTVAVGGGNAESAAVKCVGFSSIELVLGEGETWEEAFRRATALIFSAR